MTSPGTAEWTSAVNRVCGRYEDLTAKTMFAAAPHGRGSSPGTTGGRSTTCPPAGVDPSASAAWACRSAGCAPRVSSAAIHAIRAACVAGWMTEFAHQLRNHLAATRGWCTSRALSRPSTCRTSAALHAPGALLVQQCRRDTLYPSRACRARWTSSGRIYAKAGIAERFRGTFYDEPHSFTPEMQDEAFAWFDRWL